MWGLRRSEAGLVQLAGGMEGEEEEDDDDEEVELEEAEAEDGEMDVGCRATLSCDVCLWSGA